MLIVTYHAIASPASPVCCPPEAFEAQLAGLRRAGFSFASLEDCAAWLSGEGASSSPAIVVTFDDAYRSIVTAALPILVKYRVPAVVYVIGNRVGGDNQWPGQWASIGRMPLADRDELREWAAAGLTIGSHSSSHPRMIDLDDRQLVDELNGSADRLEDDLQVPVRHFAYPYGIRGAREVAAAKGRYQTAVNAESRALTRGDDPHDLCRLDCHDLGLALRLGTLDSFALRPYLTARRALRSVRRSLDRARGAGG